jgi:hypothetical protein
MSRRPTILALAWTEDGRRLISGGEDATIRFWDASDGSSFKVLRDNDATIGMAPSPGESTGRGVIYLLVPGVSERMLADADLRERGSGAFRLVGLLGVVPCAVLTWQAFRHLPVG